MIIQNIDQFDDIGPCVIMASPGMMQSGLSRQLFEAWCTDKRNGVIIAGYCVEGTLAKVRRERERGRGERGGGRKREREREGGQSSQVLIFHKCICLSKISSLW